MTHCAQCGAPLARRDGETTWCFRRRKTCGGECLDAYRASRGIYAFPSSNRDPYREVQPWPADVHFDSVTDDRSSRIMFRGNPNGSGGPESSMARCEEW